MEKIRGNQESTKNIEDEYHNLINGYKGKVTKMKKLERKIPQGVVNEEIAAAIRIIDDERHEIHLKLLESGIQIGKNKNDVLVDIIRLDGTMEEYELPEFSILTENDIIDTGYWHNPYYFNVNPDLRRPNITPFSRRVQDEGKSLLKSDEIMIVYSIVPIENYGEDELEPEDYEERIKRAHALAEAVGGRIFEERDTGYHEAEAKILGVIIPKNDLEKVAVMIKKNPDEYRIGQEYYSGEAKNKLEPLDKIRSIIEEITGLKSDLERLPQPIEGTEILQDKKIAMVDDDGEVFEAFIPELIVATNGKAIFIPHGRQSEAELVDEIFETKADIILLDLNLSMGVNGAEIAEMLKKKGFPGEIIGFSSAGSAYMSFYRSGALGAVDKDIDSPVKSIIKLADLLIKSNQKPRI
jgi:hypothetical protein